MFKRRKQDDRSETELPSAPDVARSGAKVPATTDLPRPPTPETGLGVPPFRPAAPAPPGSNLTAPNAPASNALAPNATKEAPMNRPPLPTPPQAGPAPSAVPSSLGVPRPPMAPGARPGAPAPREEGPERRTLVVGRGISVQGSVQDAERLVVEGTVEATNIRATELAVAPGGIFRGEIEVEEVELAGTIDGTLVAHGMLVVRASGKLLGAARCRRLQVEDGGQISGRVEMITDGAPRSDAMRIGEAPKPLADKPAPVPPIPAERVAS